MNKKEKLYSIELSLTHDQVDRMVSALCKSGEIGLCELVSSNAEEIEEEIEEEEEEDE